MMPAPARRSENKAEALAREVAIEIGQEAEADKPAFVEHTVTGEDTLQGILIHYGAKLSDLQRDNGFTGKNFQMCNVLKIRSTAPAMDPRAETAETKYKRCLQSFIEAAEAKMRNSDEGCSTGLGEPVSLTQAKYYIQVAKSDLAELGEKETEERVLDLALTTWWRDMEWEKSNKKRSKQPPAVKSEAADVQSQSPAARRRAPSGSGAPAGSLMGPAEDGGTAL